MTDAPELDRETIFVRYYAYLRAVAKRLIDLDEPIDRAVDLDDLSQEIAANVVRKFHLFDPNRGKFTTWLAFVARGTINNFRQDAHRQKRTPARLDARGHAHLKIAADPKAKRPDDHRADFWSFVARQLDERERRVLEARFIEGREFRDIEKRMGLARRRANNLCDQALAKLVPLAGALMAAAGLN